MSAHKALLINTFLLFTLAGVIVFWSARHFGKSDELNLEEWEKSPELVFDQEIQLSELSVLKREGRDSLMLFPGSIVTLHWEEDTEQLTVDLKQGRVLSSSLAGDFSVTLNTEFARLNSVGGLFVAELGEATLQAYAVEHPLDMVFLKEGEELNALSISSGGRVKISESKVDERVGKLRLTKLSKEFPILPIEAADLDQSTQDLLQEVRADYAALAVEEESALARRAITLPEDYLVQKVQYFGQGFRDKVTLFPHARQRLLISKREELLSYALGEILEGQEAEGLNLLASWEDLNPSKEEASQLLKDLFFVLPGDPLYPVKAAARAALNQEGTELLVLRQLFNEMESLLNLARSQDAMEAYQAYQADFEEAFKKGVFENKEDLSDLSREYVLLEGLLRKNEVFYSLSVIDLLSKMEDQILVLTGSDQDASEERQAFVQSKIRFLNNLIVYAQDRRVPVEVAGELGAELLLQAKEQMNKISIKTAVTSYFENEIESLDLSVKYLNSPEFGLVEDFKVGLAEFEAKQAELGQLNDYLSDLRVGEEVESEISLEDALFEVRSSLTRAGVVFKNVESLGDAGNRLFKIEEAKIKDLPFEASYDRVTGLLYDISVEGLNFSSGLDLDRFYEVVSAALSSDALIEDAGSEPPVGEDTPVQSSTEKLALDFAAQQFEEAGFVVEDFSFRLIDLEQNQFSFEGSMEGGALLISGTFLGETGQVEDISWEFKGKSYILLDSPLSKLRSAVLAAYGHLQ